MGKQIEKLLPQNIEAEMGVLGSIIIDPEAIDQVIGYLRPEDFYRDAHRLIYETVMNLKQQGNEADYITVCDILERRDKLELVGGASYITSLINQVPTSGNIGYYGRIVQRTGVLRRLVAATGQIAALIYEDMEVEQVLEQAERTIFEISQNFLLSTSTDIGMGPLMSLYMEILERRHEMRGEIVGVPTGYVDLDRLLGGLQRSDLDILAARTSIGKTALAINIAYNAAINHKRNVGIFSLEMSREQLAQRFVALDAGIEQQKLRTGRFDDYTWEPLINAVGKLAELGERGIRIDDTAGISLLQVRSRARRWVAEYGIELIIIDYLQLVTTGDNRKYENRQQEVSAISRGLKALARELNVPVLALAQLSRQLESRQSKVPQLSDLRESGCLTGDTPIYLPDEGIYRQIKDLVGQSGFRVLALNTETWKLEPHTVTNAFSTGRKQTYKITTRLGRTIRATANHKFLTIHGWKRLDELQSGTHLALPRNLPGPSNQSMTNAELALLGHLIGDGCTLERSAIEYITGDYGLAEGVMHLATEVFGDRVRPQGNAYCGTGLYKQNMSRERAARLAKIVLSEPLMALAQSDVYWDSILSISIDEETEVYDLTVEGLHNFVASDIIVHNSIENDADVVMFIYRDEVYNPETERKGQADIIVAKHRNGPTGEVVLAFDQARSRFRDLDIAITPDGEIAFAKEDSESEDDITR